MADFEAEVASAFAVLGHFAGLLPAVATIFALMWYAINIWESPTVQAWRARRKANPITVQEDPND